MSIVQDQPASDKPQTSSVPCQMVSLLYTSSLKNLWVRQGHWKNCCSARLLRCRRNISEGDIFLSKSGAASFDKPRGQKKLMHLRPATQRANLASQAGPLWIGYCFQETSPQSLKRPCHTPHQLSPRAPEASPPVSFSFCFCGLPFPFGLPLPFAAPLSSSFSLLPEFLLPSFFLASPGAREQGF